jgi:hypothetical protein
MQKSKTGLHEHRWKGLFEEATLKAYWFKFEFREKNAKNIWQMIFATKIGLKVNRI